ncbi:leucine-rich repeat protein kinase family protein [Artemisia annua]|uniref:Leucine-rich repeat protein kinase family protein n=1 Tax=Artemisia annua TaxID=35608 RepID=A0A2U1M2A6_ARTAN|nr:leucine-rich repeat protein kinase family protein [Artemisia annua]
MRSSPSSLFFIFFLLTQHLTASEDFTEEETALKTFLHAVQLNSSKMNWGTEKKTCNWTGVHCDNPTGSQVFVDYFQLPASCVVGKIPSNSLGKIKSLRVLSLHDNKLSGQFPDDFDSLTELRNAYLHANEFSGPFPSSVSKWTKLYTLDLSNNNFTGDIPSNYISNLKQIMYLYLQNNSFSGWLPDTFPSTLKNFSVAYNNFTGEIPKSLANKFPASAFAGNPLLCGTPLKRCPPGQARPPSSPSAPITSDPENKKKLSTGDTIAIAIGSAWILLISLICLGKKWSRSVKEKKTEARTGRGEAGTSSSKEDDTGAKLVFFEGGGCSFDLEHLFRASAEVLGKGSVGKTYKTVLKEGEGITVVVKRLKDVDVSKEEFEGVMEELGKMKDENVVPIRAYYYSKDEKLLVCDYYPAGSLFALLHGSRGSGRPPLDWDHRLRIALSAAKGVVYLHVKGKMIHGNIKSSNILLRQDSKKDAFVSDFGLNKLFGGSSSPNTRVTGYHAPEILKTRKVTFESDVYSFGVLLLELLTGKAPNQASLGEEGFDLPRWVRSVEREKWTTEVFDVELMRYQNTEEEMVQLLQLAMACVLIEPDQRPAMQEVLRKMEDLRNSPNTVTP